MGLKLPQENMFKAWTIVGRIHAGAVGSNPISKEGRFRLITMNKTLPWSDISPTVFKGAPKLRQSKDYVCMSVTI
jgi:hypothetical protein